MVGGALMSPGWPSQSPEGTGIGPAGGALWLNSAAWELKPMQVPKMPFGIFLVCKVKRPGNPGLPWRRGHAGTPWWDP